MPIRLTDEQYNKIMEQLKKNYSANKDLLNEIMSQGKTLEKAMLDLMDILEEDEER